MQPKIECIPEKTHYATNGNAMHVLIRIHAPKAVPNPTRIPLNLALVLDRSGSMSGAKLEYAKAAAKYVMERLHAEDRVSLVTFDDVVEIALPNSAAQNVNIEKVLKTIEDRGSTNLHGGWLEGGTQVATKMRDGALNRVLLLSDGMANAGITDTASIANDVRGLAARGISTSTFGVGRDFDEDMMQAIAQAGDGNYYFIEHPNDLPRIFAAELSGLNNTFARTVSLGLETQNGVKILDVLNDIPRNQNGRLMLPNLMFDGTLEVLVKLEIPAGLNLEALRLRLAYSPATGNDRIVTRETLHLSSVTDNEYRNLHADERVLEGLALFEVARAKIEMMKKLDAGDDTAVAGLLQQQTTTLAAAPASAKVREEMASIQELTQDLRNNRTVMRKKAGAQAYEKQRGR